MKLYGILLAIFLKCLCVENRMLPLNYKSEMPPIIEDSMTEMQEKEGSPHERVIGLKNYEDKDPEEYSYELERRRIQSSTKKVIKNFEDKDPEEYSYELERKHSQETTKKPCAIVVLSNSQSPSMQSLLRKYRYNANGILIPSSVQYYIKLPQGLRASPLLVPLNDKAFSPLGGFVRYYKEVPPIPQSWKR